jgi:hypothetical protein
MTRLCLCGLSLAAILVLAAPSRARADGDGGIVKADGGPAAPANPAPNQAGEEPAPGVPLWVWAGGAIAAALFAVGLMVRMGMNQSPPARLEFPRTVSRADLPPEGHDGNDPYAGNDPYPDDPTAGQQP